MPIQGLVTLDMVMRTNRYPEKGETRKVAFNPVGQIVGRMNQVLPAKVVVENMIDEYVDAIDRMQESLAED